MLLNCNARCKKSDGKTDGSLEPETNDVICNTCGDVLTNVSDYTKQTLKQNKDIIKKSKKAFMFDCKNCHKKVETVVVNGIPMGKGCQTKNCVISISEMMANAMEKISPAISKLDEE